MRHLIAALVALLLAVAGCPAAGTPVADDPNPALGDVAEGEPGNAPGSQPVDEKSIPPELLVWVYEKGQRRPMGAHEAEAQGLTIVDLSDDWVPYIFWPQTPGQEDFKENNYLEDYVDLANDRIDVDGVALDKWERNYLEVYGIPPSLSVLAKRLADEEGRACYQQLNYKIFSEYYGSVRIVDPAGSKAEERRYQSARADYRRALSQARVKTLEALLKKPAFQKVAENYRKYEWRRQAIRQMQKRLLCEEMFGRRPPPLTPGVITWHVKEALRDFERKHNVYGWGMMFQDTVDALGRTPRQNVFESLKRVLTERVISGARILEDGTISKATYKGKSGKTLPVRNLTAEYAAVLLQELGLSDADKAAEFIKSYAKAGFAHLWVAVRLPPPPEYYADQMDLSVIIDRGDVWYDIPFDKDGKPLPQPRGRFPHLTLFVNYRGQQIPLVRWRTTIGSWQAEMRNGQEYVKYKISDVGPRIWKNIIAGPVWIPPVMTPSRDMVKARIVAGQGQRIVAHQAFGPGYASAYGLVAAFHVTKEGFDNQVRTHGSVNYMSIKSNGFSHGCHRLFNYRAVRLFSFVLAHRRFVRKGQSKLAYDARFEHLGEEFQMDLRTRGYYYELTPPVPVNVLEGRIRGKVDKPIEEYIKKPTVVYQEDLPTLQHKAPAGAPRIQPKKGRGLMSQEQNL